MLDHFPLIDAQPTVQELLLELTQPEPWYKEDYMHLVKGLTHVDVNNIKTLIVPFGKKVFPVAISFSSVVLMAAGKLGKARLKALLLKNPIRLKSDMKIPFPGPFRCCWSPRLLLQVWQRFSRAINPGSQRR